MSVPDYVTPIVGYRAWSWAGPHYLKSLTNQQPWPPGKPMVAKCQAWPHHKAPQEICTCGIYALKTITQKNRNQFPQFPRGDKTWPCLIVGEVYLWGKVIEHQYGWRAQFAYPKSLSFLWGRWLGATEMEALAAYGADLYHMPRPGKGEGVLLWTRQLGYSDFGKGLLAQATEKPDKPWMWGRPN